MKQILFIFSIFSSSFLHAVHHHPIVVTIPSRNNVTICTKNLGSVFAQTYDNYRIIYIDDASDDGTYEAVCEYITACNKWDRVTLLRNSVRHGQMYNHFVAGHLCENHEIIVNLDGDDWLAPNALDIINRAYQDPNVWMTYGQYREEPHGKMGHCRRIPQRIHTERAYRYYDWITSHARTYYAGLFKQVPVGYFIQDTSFQPSAADLALMFPMLELSGGKIAFIDTVIYHYNCANPNNIFRKNVTQQLRMNYLCRGREPLKPLTFDPRIPKKDTTLATTALIIISENNPDALHKTLESYNASGTDSDEMHIVYVASDIDMDYAYHQISEQYPAILIHKVDNNLKETLQNICASTCPYLILASDTTLFCDTIDCERCIALLEKTHACGFYFDKDNAPSCNDTMPLIQPLVPLESEVYVWKFKHAQGLWRVAYTCDGALYRTSDIKSVLKTCSFNTLDELRYAFVLYGQHNQEDVGLCFNFF